MKDLFEASRSLFELELDISTDHIVVEVVWFRLVYKDTEWFTKRHRHSGFEIHYLIEGSLGCIIGDRQFFMGVGDLIVIPPGVDHTLWYTGAAIKKYALLCRIEGGEVDDPETEFLKETLYRGTVEPVNVQGFRVTSLFDAALEEAAERRSGFLGSLRSLLLLILVDIARIIAGNPLSNYPVQVKVRSSDYRLAQITQFLESEGDRPVSVEELARFVNLGPRQLNRIILDKCGVTARKLIASYRVKRAKELLKDQALSLPDIADLLGFTNEYYFNRFFKREEGMPPGNYRYSMIDAVNDQPPSVTMSEKDKR